MRLFTGLFTILVLTITTTKSYSQILFPMSDNEFIWNFDGNCNDSKLELFKVLSNPPKLKGEINQIYKDVNQILKKYLNKKSEEKIFKIKLFTVIGNELCLGGIGVNTETDQALLEEIKNYISQYTEFEYGNHMGKVQNCVSEMYLITNKNKLNYLELYNLRLK